MPSAYTFKCACCKWDYDEDEAHMEEQFGAPICGECRRNCIKATAWLKHAGISRPVEATDVNTSNHKRFLVP